MVFTGIQLTSPYEVPDPFSFESTPAGPNEMRYGDPFKHGTADHTGSF